jgi:hypothetical protein
MMRLHRISRKCWRSQIISFALTAAVMFAVLPSAADSQTIPSATNPTRGARSSSAYPPDYSGWDMTRPENYFETRLYYQTSEAEALRTNRLFWELRRGGYFALDDSWKVGWLIELPVVAETTDGSTPGNSSKELGIGDVFSEATLSRTVNDRLAYTFGARFIAPTGGDRLGNGKWEVLPIVGVRYSFLEFGNDTYFVPTVRYAISFAGDPSRRNISEPQIAPTLNVGLPDHWFVTFYPSHDIRINFGDPIRGQTGRLFLPFDAAIGKKIMQNLSLMWEASVPIIKEYPVYTFKTDLRIKLTF